MFCRAKISVLLPLVGVLTASGAPLKPGQRNPAFQPGGTALFALPVVLRPADATLPIQRRVGVPVQRIVPSTQALVRAGLGGVTFTKAGDAKVAPDAVQKAGGDR